MRQLLSTAALAALLLFSACGGGKKTDTKTSGDKVKSARAGINEVIVHINASPDKLNPITHTNSYAQQVTEQIFMSALGLDPDSIGVIIPALAVNKPTITEINEGEFKGGLKIDYEIRPEAKWDNGSPITANDAIFSIKVWKNPQVDCEQGRPYYEFIKDIVVNPSNDHKYSVITKDKYFLSDLQSGFTFLPEYNYDPDGIMRKFTIKELNDPAKAKQLKNNPDIIKFADKFNGEYFARDPKGVSGCGPYALESWEANQRVILKKKANWWGNALAGKVEGFEAYPDKIIFEIIPDYPGSLSALKGEKLDVHSNLQPKDYLDLSTDGKLSTKYNFYKPGDLGYNYMPMNTRSAKLKDVRVRRAMAHLLNVDEIIHSVMLDLAVRVSGPTSRFKTNIYNADLKPIDYNIETAKNLLTEAGWKDTDGDGILDKVINGVKTKMSINFMIPNGSPIYDKISLLYKESCKKAGVELNIQVKEFTVMSDDLQHHNFEMSFLGWGGVSYEDDPAQLWHTKSYNGGSNYTGFGDAKSDALIEKIRYEANAEKRAGYQKELQQMIYDAQPYIFMYSRLNRMCIHKRFENADPKISRPGFVVSDFKLNKDFGQ